MRILLSAATAVVILALALLLLMTPVWMHFALGAAGSTAPGTDPVAASDRTVADLLTLGDFDIGLYTVDERAHMRDVQVVLYAFLGLAAAAALFAGWRMRSATAGEWSAVARGGAGLVVGIVVLGVFGLLAFDAAFTLFHQVFFPGGNWAFPADSNLIRLYPEPFWQLSAGALGVLAIIGGGATWWLARRRAAVAAA